MTVAAIVQARISSTRLPGKVLLELAGRTVLDHVLSRCRATKGVDVVCCAIPSGDQQDPVAAEAERSGAIVFRGSEFDVLDRYHKAAKSVGADTILRVTSDCPVIDPAICDDLITLHRAKRVDYACNNMPPSWPHGLDCEVFSAAALDRTAAFASANQREHVTTWLRESEGVTRQNLLCPVPGLAHYRWTLDYPEDFAFFRALFAVLGGNPSNDWRSVLSAVEQRPDLAALNSMRNAYAPTSGK